VSDITPEPQRVLQLFLREAQEQWKDTTPLQRLEWLDFALYAVWAGAAYRAKADKNPPHDNGSRQDETYGVAP
jgi:hypothetical protein